MARITISIMMMQIMARPADGINHLLVKVPSMQYHPHPHRH
jgi:hypothetical protein